MRIWPHDDPLPIPFTKLRSSAKRPGNSYICIACQMFRKQRRTIHWLSDTTKFKDSIPLESLSWWITEGGSYAIGKECWLELYKHLLQPPLRFTLMIGDIPGRNLLHLAVCNDFCEIKADTELVFTLDNVPCDYTAYELRLAVQSTSPTDLEGKRFGVRYLANKIRPFIHKQTPNLDITTQETTQRPRKRGRPTNDTGLTAAQHDLKNWKDVTRCLAASGQVIPIVDTV